MQTSQDHLELIWVVIIDFESSNLYYLDSKLELIHNTAIYNKQVNVTIRQNTNITIVNIFKLIYVKWWPTFNKKKNFWAVITTYIVKIY